MRFRHLLSFLSALILGSNLYAPNPAEAQVVLTEPERLARQLLTRSPKRLFEALDLIVQRGNQDMTASLIVALRFAGNNEPAVREALEKLTGAKPGTGRWEDWMTWQEDHPEVKPFNGFDAFKADVMAAIDNDYRLFLKRGIKHEIRLEEIVWGGVQAKDGIPALNYPTHVSAQKAQKEGYLIDDELVFGIEINGDVRAYPLRYMDWHEMFNDKIGGKHVALAYCTLCASGILYETDVPPKKKPIVFGSSGMLYRSNKLMFDEETLSLWNQFTGKPVVGPLVGSGIELKVLPVAITSWKEWRDSHPNTKVLWRETGHVRDYAPGQPYGTYFASPDLMFPALVSDHRQRPKDFVFALRTFGIDKSWPLDLFDGGKVINDKANDLDVVLVGRTETRTVRAYAAEGIKFEAVDGDLHKLKGGGKTWRVTETGLVSTTGKKTLKRLPGHVAYWFAWQNYKPKAAYGGPSKATPAAVKAPAPAQ